MKGYILSDPALDDLEDIRFRLTRLSPEAALNTLQALFNTFSVLVTFPNIGRERSDLGAELRSIVSDVYVVIYRVHADVMQIVRILHGRRRMGKSLFRE